MALKGGETDTVDEVSTGHAFADADKTRKCLPGENANELFSKCQFKKIAGSVKGSIILFLICKSLKSNA